MPAIAKKKNSVPQRDPDEPRFDLAKAKRGPSRYANVPIAFPLEGLRKFAGRTQVEVSRASGIPQGEVSKIENREDLDVLQIATLRKYVEALGGELELVAIVHGKRVVIKRHA